MPAPAPSLPPDQQCTVSGGLASCVPAAVARSRACRPTRTLCPSGLRGWTQVPLARAAWAQIPQVSLFQPLGLGYPALPLSSLPEGCFTYYAALVLERSGPAEQQDSPMLAWAHRHQRLPAVPDSSCSYADPSGSWPNLASPTPRMGGYVRDRACHVAPCLCMCVG